MKKLVIAATVALFSSNFAFAGASTKVMPPIDIKGIHRGASLEELTAINPAIRREPGMSFVLWPSSMTIGGVTITDIDGTFDSSDKLTMFMGKVRPENALILIEALKQKFPLQCTVSEKQNGYGARFQVTSCTYEDAEGSAIHVTDRLNVRDGHFAIMPKITGPKANPKDL